MGEVYDAVEGVIHRLVRKGGGDSADGERATVGDESPPVVTPEETWHRLGVSPEDYLVRLLRSRGGRLKQQQIVAETGWSESCVSRVLSEMEDDGRVGRVPLGREKVVCVPSTMPEATTVNTVTA